MIARRALPAGVRAVRALVAWRHRLRPRRRALVRSGGPGPARRARRQAGRDFPGLPAFRADRRLPGAATRSMFAPIRPNALRARG
jgi:hypothetical protein